MSCSTEIKTRAKMGEGGGGKRKVTLFAPDKGFIDKTALARNRKRVFPGLLSNITCISIFICRRVGYILTMIT